MSAASTPDSRRRARLDRAAVGREVSSGLYYEILGDRTGYPYPVVLIHGGGSMGSTYRGSPDGRRGWADLLAERGFEMWVTDWPGSGRSGYRDILTLSYDDVVDGYRALLTNVIGEPVVLCCHSMGGAITWKLLELEPDLVAGVVATASAYPANLARPSEIVSDDGEVMKVIFGDTGVHFTVDRRKPYTYGDDYIFKQAIGDSTQFPMDHIENLKAGLGPMSPVMLMQRIGVIPGMPIIEDPAGFSGKGIRLVTGGQDPAHTYQIELRTRDLLREWGADAELVWLPDRGIHGNGHFLTAERNSAEVLDVVEEELKVVAQISSRP